MLLVGLVLLVAPAAVRAQDRPNGNYIPNQPDSIIRMTVKALRAAPLDIEALRKRFTNGLADYPRGPIAEGVIPPLDPAHQMRLRNAAVMRDRGQFAGARDSLKRLADEVPHHPLILTEYGRAMAALTDWSGLERLAKSERQMRKDSLLLGRELAQAEERLGKPTDAALTAIEVWVASPTEREWAEATLTRLLPADNKAAREALRRAVAREPARADLARGLAKLQWRASDSPGMVATLGGADRAIGRPTVRWGFADELLRSGVARDTTGALDVLMDIAADHSLSPAFRLSAARRVWDVDQVRGTCSSGAPALAKALGDLKDDEWDPAFALAIARSLRESGRTTEARALLDSSGRRASSDDLALERALTDLRDGPPERALPALRTAAAGSMDGAFQYAEALFFAGQCDSALTWYQRVADDPAGAHTGAALERAFLIEDADPKEALPLFSRAAYAAWRGNTHEASAIADSLYRTLPRRSLWVQSALLLSRQRDAAGETQEALEPLLAVADSLPGDRLAPLARQRAGDLYRDRLHDQAGAIAQYEACLTRYPRAWNAPEVRRSLERLRREPGF